MLPSGSHLIYVIYSSTRFLGRICSTAVGESCTAVPQNDAGYDRDYLYRGDRNRCLFDVYIVLSTVTTTLVTD